MRLLAVIAAHGAQARGADVLRHRGIAAFQEAIGTRIALAPSLPPRLPAGMVGTHFLKDDLYALGVGLTFGHAEAETLRALTDIARAHGALWARPAPDRSLLLGPFKRTTIKTMRDEAQRLGFAVDPADPRRRIVACPGAPSCASGLIAARTIAAEIAQIRAAARPRCCRSCLGLREGLRPSRRDALTIVGTAGAAASCATERHAPRPRPMPFPRASLRRSTASSKRRRSSMLKHDYIRDGAAIYERSFAIIRAEADLSRFSAEEADIVVRMVHACGQI